jgi:hypothetical protein
MFQIDPLKGMWTLKHLKCGASFEITGENIMNRETIRCPNCNVSTPEDFVYIQKAAEDLEQFHSVIGRVTSWDITPPIIVLEEEENKRP